MQCLWLDGVMIRPDIEGIQQPNTDLDQEIKDDYEEARGIVTKSPRGASALLRLALQKLCKQLGEPGKQINDDIANLVKKGSFEFYSTRRQLERYEKNWKELFPKTVTADLLKRVNVAIDCLDK